MSTTKIAPHFHATTFVARLRSSIEYRARKEAIADIHRDQPEVLPGLEHLGSSFFGDVRVDLHGSVHYVGSRIEDIDLEDVTITGTTISLRDSLDSKEWARLQREAIEQYERSLVYVPDHRGADRWIAV